MYPSRRSFLGSTLAWVAAIAAAAQAQGPRPGFPPLPDQRDDPFGWSRSRTPKFNPRNLMAANQKKIREDVARLSDIVEQMKKQLEDNDTRDVLPVDVIRQTEEIEKLAKHIKSLVRG